MKQLKFSDNCSLKILYMQCKSNFEPQTKFSCSNVGMCPLFPILVNITVLEGVTI